METDRYKWIQKGYLPIQNQHGVEYIQLAGYSHGQLLRKLSGK